MTDDPEDFWSSLPCLETVHQFAQSRRVGPWALLGAAMIRAIASIGPEVQVPGLVGSPCSLNLFVASVGRSGHGKGITDGAARALVACDAIPEYPVGTGEGLARTFAPNSNGDAVTRAIFTASEVDTLRALGDRSGATLFPELRKLYVGEPLGFANAGKDTRLVVGAQSYRACLSIGVQPSQAGVLLNDAGGGTPQRIVWLPVGDPDAPDIAPEEPERLRVSRGIWGSPPIYVRVPEVVQCEIDANRLRVLRGDPDADPLDGHKLLTQVKVATALALLDGAGINVDERHWIAARAVMAVSDRTRSHIQNALTDEVRKVNRARAHAAADRDEMVADRKLRRAKDAVVRWLERDGEMSFGDLRKRARSDWRDQVGAAATELQAEGVIVEIPVDRGSRFRLSEGSTVDPRSTPENRSSETVDPRSKVDRPRTPKQTCAQWVRQHVLDLLVENVDTVESADLFAAGEAAGYRVDNLRRAAMESELISTAARTGRSVTYRLGAGGSSTVVSAPDWLASWLAEREWVRSADAYAAAEEAGYERATVKSAALRIRVEKRGASIHTEWRHRADTTTEEQPA